MKYYLRNMSFTFVARPGSLVRNRDFVIAVAARSVSLLGDMLAVTTLVLLVQQRGESAWTLTALFGAGLLPMVVLAPLIGRLVDGTDSRVLLAVGGAGAAATCVAMACVTPTSALIALAALLGVLEGVLASTWAALVPAIVGRERVAAATGLMQSVSGAALLVGPAAAGLLTAEGGYRVPLLLDAATFAAIGAAGLLIRTRRVPPRAAGGVGAAGGYALLRRDPVLWAATVLMAAFLVLACTLNVIDVYLVRETLHSGPGWYGLFGSVWGAGVLASSGPAGRAGGVTGQSRVLLGGTVALAAATLGLAVVPAVGWLIPVGLVGGAGNGMVNVGGGSLMMLRCAPEARGRISATVNGIMSAAQLAAFVLGGALASSLPPRAAFALAGLLALAVPAVLGPRLLRTGTQSDRLSRTGTQPGFGDAPVHHQEAALGVRRMGL